MNKVTSGFPIPAHSPKKVAMGMASDQPLFDFDLPPGDPEPQEPGGAEQRTGVMPGSGPSPGPDRRDGQNVSRVLDRIPAYGGGPERLQETNIDHVVRTEREGSIPPSAPAWREIPQARFLSWSAAMQLAYCAARDEDAAVHETSVGWQHFYTERAKTYRDLITK